MQARYERNGSGCARLQHSRRRCARQPNDRVRQSATRRGGGGRGAACAQKGSSGSPGWIELVAGFISSVCMGECGCQRTSDQHHTAARPNYTVTYPHPPAITDFIRSLFVGTCVWGLAFIYVVVAVWFATPSGLAVVYTMRKHFSFSRNRIISVRWPGQVWGGYGMVRDYARRHRMKIVSERITNMRTTYLGATRTSAFEDRA